MSGLTPRGTAKDRFQGERGAAENRRGALPMRLVDPDDFEPAYLGWEIARCAQGLADEERAGLASLAAACIASIRSGSTRLPIDAERLATALAAVGAEEALAAALRLLGRARSPVAGEPVAAVIGRPGDRKPLIIDGGWLYAERMLVLEDRLCARVRERLRRDVAPGPLRRGQGLVDPRRDARAIARAVSAVAPGPPAFTDEQKRAVREALSAGLALITGGPGTGKTTTAVGLIRALAWMGVPMESVAIAAPTGKAAQRLSESIANGLASTSRDIADAGLRAMAPGPQTLHRLLGWSPSSARFARHENDPLPYRVVIVDEASMIDLAMMDRLLRALSDDARLVLFGDADQLPSVEAGAVFRDMCASLGAVRLTTNLRVAGDTGAGRIVGAAEAVISGVVDVRFAAAVATRGSVDEVVFEGVEHLAVGWSDVDGALLERWWRALVATGDEFARRTSRTYRWRGGAFGDEDGAELRSLHEHYARARILCATRGSGLPTSADAINARFLALLRGGGGLRGRGWRVGFELLPGAPVLVQRNDYERGLYNGDQGVIVRVDPGDDGGSRLMGVFPRGGRSFDVVPLDASVDIAPAFALTVHKAQGSEFDHVALVLPEADMPLLTRELIYTAITRARRSALIVGAKELLARAVARTSSRDSGVGEKLAKT
jgi:exodeoxyribonuclease V alpha subunit